MAGTRIEVTVNVTEDDIARGCQGHSHECPVALALRRCFPRAAVVDVQYKYAYIKLTPKSDYLSARLPKSAGGFISNFDFSTSKPQKPFCFRLRFAPLKQPSSASSGDANDS